MDCNKADDYIMKYMDGEITDNEAVMLNEHLLNCKMCRESFNIYDSMLNEFMSQELIKAPEGFEIQVMAKISVLDENMALVHYNAKNKIGEIIWGTFTILFASGTILVLYRDHIINSLLNNPYIGDKVQLLIPVADSVNYQAEVFKSAAEQTVSYFNTTIANSVGIIFSILAVLCALQFYILRKKRKINKADEK